jgi:uncharacterized spore protein YtfJ
LGTSLNSNLEVLFNQMENFITSKTVIGDAIHIDDGIVIIPLIDISLGVAASAVDSNSKKKESGAGGLGAKITPSSILVIQNENVQLINIKNQDGLTKLIDLVPGLLSKINLTKKKEKE